MYSCVMAVQSGGLDYSTLNDNQHKAVEEFRHPIKCTFDSQPAYGPSITRSQHNEESLHDNDNNHLSLATPSGTNERHRLDSARSGDSGYESRRRSRLDSDSSYITTASDNRINGLKSIDTDERVCDTCATETSEEGNEHIVEVKRDVNQSIGTRESIENCVNNIIAETKALRPYARQHGVRNWEEANCECMNKPICTQNSILSTPELSGPPRRGHCNHRKRNSFSFELTNERQRVAYRAQTRKRYKSEGNAESDPLLVEYEQSLDFRGFGLESRTGSDEVRVLKKEGEGGSTGFEDDNCKFESEDSKEYGTDINRLNDSTKIHLSSDRIDYAVGLSESSRNIGTFESDSKQAEQDSYSVRSSLASVTLRDKVITKYTVSPKLEIDPDDSLRDSQTVNYDKHDLAQNAEENKASSVELPDSGHDKPARAGNACRTVCCDVCSSTYAELITRIDKLTTDYQWQNRRTGEALASTRQLKVYLTRLIVIGVLIVTVVVTLGLAVVVLRSFLGCSNLVHEVNNRNMTSHMAGLGQRLSGVADMVNDLMTKSTSILRLTNRNGYSAQAGQHYVTWQTRDHEGQGDLRLSDTGDSVIMTSGGYYVIYVKLQYTTSLTAQTNVRLEYDVVQVAVGGARSVQHTIRQFTAASGPLRQEIPTQATLYAYPGDTIQVSLRSDQLPLLANFSKAHELSMFGLK